MIHSNALPLAHGVEMEIKIEDGVPFSGAIRESSGLYAAMKKMQIGQSMIIPDCVGATTPYTLARGHGIKVAIRVQPDGARRMWRTA